MNLSSFVTVLSFLYSTIFESRIHNNNNNLDQVCYDENWLSLINENKTFDETLPDKFIIVDEDLLPTYSNKYDILKEKWGNKYSGDWTVDSINGSHLRLQDGIKFEHHSGYTSISYYWQDINNNVTLIQLNIDIYDGKYRNRFVNLNIEFKILRTGNLNYTIIDKNKYISIKYSQFKQKTQSILWDLNTKVILK